MVYLWLITIFMRAAEYVIAAVASLLRNDKKEGAPHNDGRREFFVIYIFFVYAL